jgi:hypothetical protein
VTVAMTDGPLGLEAVHEWTSGGFGNPSFVLNDMAAASGHRVKVSHIAGWRSQPDLPDPGQVQRYGRMGADPLGVSAGGRTFTYDFAAQKKTAQAFRQMQSAIVRAFAERDALGTMKVKPVSPYGDPGDYWWYQARVMGCDMDESMSGSLSDPRGWWKTDGTLGLFLFEPRFFWADQTDTGADASSPLVVTNDGFIDANPQLLVVVGTACDLLQIENTTLGGGYQLSFDNLPAGTWVIDFATRQVYDAGDPTVDGYRYMTAEKPWWDERVPGLIPGSNSISWTVTGAGAVSSVRALFYPPSL